jgi:glycosyltransferase involved in cell wall biosynthesis
MQRADRVVAVSTFLAEQVRELYCCPRDIEVIHNAWPAPPPAPTQLRSGTLLAGRVWDSAKNIPLAAVAGRGWDPGAVHVAGHQRHPETGSAMPLEPPLQPLGHLPHPELKARLSRAAIYLSPARYDPFGLLPLQAALSGATLLLSDIPSYRELWTGTACFFRSDDPDDLRRHWQRLLTEPGERERLSAAARTRAIRDYSVERFATAYQRLYATAGRAVPV